MAILSRLFGKSESVEKVHGSVQFPLVLKDQTRDEGSYSVWARNHRWNERNAEWCRSNMETFSKHPTIGILMQSRNPRPEFMQESLSTIFNQIYPFHRLYIVDRGSTDPKIRQLMEQVEKDPRVKVSFQKGSEHDTEAIARIMKKADSEWLLLMGAEDIIEPYTLYSMAAYLQDQVDIDFVFADSDLIDDRGLRFNPQFKPVWAVGASYPLGYYQHPVLLSARIVDKLRGYERVSALMEEGTLLDEASNHSRFVIQAPGILYHARARGLKNETPPDPVWNVLINENYRFENDRIVIDDQLRIAAEPPAPLKLLWIVDSFDLDDGPALFFYLARYFKKNSGHTLTILSSSDGPFRALYEEIGAVKIVPDQEVLADQIEHLHKQNSFHAAFVASMREPKFPEKLASLEIPSVWQISSKMEPNGSLKDSFSKPATIVFPSQGIADSYRSFDQRGILRTVPTGVDLGEIKLYKQKNSPIDLRTQMGISRTATVIIIAGPTIERKGQKVFVDAAIELMKRHPDTELEFFIVGERPGSYLDEVKSIVQSSNHPERFHLVKETASPIDRYPYFWISDVCVSCSTEETYPLTVLEAMAFKKAVVATNVNFTNEVIQDGDNGYFFQAGNVQDLAAKLEPFAQSRDLAEAVGREGLEMVMEKFALKKTAARINRLLRESIVSEY